MDKYAVVEIGGKQFPVVEGEEIEVEKIEGKEGKSISFDKILLLVDGQKIKIGQPVIKGVKIKAKILSQGKGEKIRVATYKAKSRYRRVIGFRSSKTRLKVEKIVFATA